MQTLLPTPEHLAARSAPHHGSAQLSCIATYTLPSRQPHQHSLPTKGTTVILFVQFIQERHDPIRFSCITSFLCPGLRDRGRTPECDQTSHFPLICWGFSRPHSHRSVGALVPRLNPWEAAKGIFWV
jgi:hypothetical protein